MRDALTTFALPAVVAALTAWFTTWLRVRETKELLGHRLEREHEQAERAKLQTLIGEHHGRLLEAVLDWDRRMGQLYDDAWKQLQVGEAKRRSRDQYLYHSYVFRFLALLGIARRFELQAFFVHAHLASESELAMLKYSKAFLWVMTNADLHPPDGLPGRDHFRNDAIRPMLDVCYLEGHGLPETRGRDGSLIFDLRRYRALLESPELDVPELDEVLGFFDGLKPDGDRTPDGEQRYRWDRLVALHLLVLAFLDTMGYDWQRPSDAELDRAIEQLHEPMVASRLLEAFPRLGLAGRPEIARLSRRLRSVHAPEAAPALGPGGARRFARVRRSGIGPAHRY